MATRFEDELELDQSDTRSSVYVSIETSTTLLEELYGRRQQAFAVS
jgi:hypothetical protein